MNMPIDPKLTTVRVPTTPITTRPVANPVPTRPNVTTLPTNTPVVNPGYSTNSTFTTPKVNTTRGSVPDDSIGRSKKGSVADDTIGRKKGTSVPDDTIGRKKGTSVPDDTIGQLATDDVRDALVGRDDTADSLALRNAIFERLETPSFLSGSTSAAAQVAAFAKTQGLSAAQQQQLGTILKGASTEVATLMGAVLEKVPRALSNVDSKGNTLLSNLARLATEPLNAKASGDTTRSEVLASVLRDIANPNRIDQGDAPTCTVTSMQFELVADEPSEYARLMADLTGPAGKAKMRGGGELVLDAGEAGARDLRSASQTIFQNAAMEYGNGRDAEFDPYAQKSVNQKTGAEQRGLKPAQQTQVLRQLFGVNYESKQFLTEADGAKALEKIRNYSARGAQNRPVVLQIDQGDFNHAVTLDSVKNERVYFRDPYGVLRSMPENQFAKHVVAMNAPRDLNVI
ncbi:MAG: hypothetical protein DI536_25370 [Archangium gephyra]|uniref:Uncharacterized protein n=1 Tax=Archangium gephyra TaxID=48 RepID=A0A2W5SXT5_9BACT|nr:MAG: hypothetical protein DI536_25370 [Archangium gephyra]